MIEIIIECLCVGIMCSICYRLGFKSGVKNMEDIIMSVKDYATMKAMIKMKRGGSNDT